MMRLLAILCAVCLLAACQLQEVGGETGASTGGAVPPTGDRSPLLVEQECRAAGGRMVVGLAGPQCAKAQPDAGKSCSDSAQCEGFCMADTRSCSKVTPFFGCHEVLTGGKRATICVD